MATIEKRVPKGKTIYRVKVRLRGHLPAGLVISKSDPPMPGSLSGWRSIAICCNATLAIFFGILAVFAGMVRIERLPARAT